MKGICSQPPYSTMSLSGSMSLPQSLSWFPICITAVTCSICVLSDHCNRGIRQDMVPKGYIWQNSLLIGSLLCHLERICRALWTFFFLIRKKNDTLIFKNRDFKSHWKNLDMLGMFQSAQSSAASSSPFLFLLNAMCSLAWCIHCCLPDSSPALNSR